MELAAALDRCRPERPGRVPTHWVSLHLRKGGDLRFLSHLDLLGVFERALRRSGLEFCWRAGFNPRPRLAAGDALPLGVESEEEFFSIALERPLEPAEVLRLIEPQLPPGISLVRAIPGKLRASPGAWRWRLTFACPLPSRTELVGRLEAAGPLADSRGRLRPVAADPGSLAVEENSLTIESLPGRGGALRPELLARALGLRPPLRVIKLARLSEPAERHGIQ